LVEVVDLLDLDWPLADAMTFLTSVDCSQTFTTMFMQLLPRVVGDALLHAGRFADARDQLEAAAAIALRIGARSELASCNFSLARVSLMQDRPHEAEQHLRTAAQLVRGRQADIAHRIEAFARRTGLSLGVQHSMDGSAPEAVEVVVMFVDIVDSTHLAWEYGDDVFRGLAARLDRRVRMAIGRCGGRAVEGVNVGDGLLAEFGSPGEALDCAADCVDLSGEIGLSLHVGLNVGTVIRERGSVFGTTVNVAARVTSQSGPSEILVTASLMERSARPFARFAEKGLVELKGIPDPVRLYSYEPHAALAAVGASG
jgi:class 3 adenylate cyclase